MWKDYILYTTDDMEKIAGELLPQYTYMPDVIRDIIGEKLTTALRCTTEELEELQNPEILKESAVYLNISLALGSASRESGDIYDTRSKEMWSRFKNTLIHAIPRLKIANKEEPITIQR